MPGRALWLPIESDHRRSLLYDRLNPKGGSSCFPQGRNRLIIRSGAVPHSEASMQDWNPDLYLRFEAERTQPARDLLARVDLPDPSLVLDLGCGPCNSPELLDTRSQERRVGKELVTTCNHSRANNNNK